MAMVEVRVFLILDHVLVLNSMHRRRVACEQLHPGGSALHISSVVDPQLHRCTKCISEFPLAELFVFVDTHRLPPSNESY